MWQQAYKYVIVGGGLAGASAIEGIRERDKDGSILMVGAELFLAYDRPPMTKKLWLGKKTINDIFVHDSEFYSQDGVDVGMGIAVVRLDPAGKTIVTNHGHEHRYEKLLLATGGIPRRLSIPGGDLSGICYYRYLDDFIRIRRDAAEGRSAVIIGGGFIGSELAAVLTENKVDVTMVFPEPYLVQRILPESLGRSMQDRFAQRGIKVLSGDVPVSIERAGGRYVTNTQNGQRLESDILLVGIGIQPSVDLAEKAGLNLNNGIVVNEFLQSSVPEIFAAGDNANFPYMALGQNTRVEHWDNALNQGKYAGMNMISADTKYDYMPYFWSDLFEFGYEAVGDLDSRLETYGDWSKENDTGVLYYLREGKVRGVMTCNIYGKMDDARELIRGERQFAQDELRGLIREEQKSAA